MPITENGLYVFEDIAFVNTSLLTEAANHYKKYKCYTKAPKGSKDYNDHWDEEERRLKYGITVPGKLVTDDKGNLKIQEVHITGNHYGFLNYARIRRKKDEIDKETILELTGQKSIKKEVDFPRFIDAQYNYFKAKEYTEQEGLNMIVAKARRKGFSYMEAWDSAITVNMNANVTVLIGAFDYKYITLGNQMMGMAKKYLDWLEDQTDFNRGYLKEPLDHIKLGYKKQDEGNKEYGYLSEIIALSFMNNPDAAVGKDAYKIKLEECGKFPNLQQSLDVTLSTVEDGAGQTGLITMFGTGGTDDANWADFEEIFFNPESRNCLAFSNIWDEGMTGNAVGFFYPQEAGYEPFIDQYGNSLIDKSIEDIMLKRDKQKKILSSEKYMKYTGQRARSPKEAFASGSDNIFPAAQINEHLNTIENDKSYKYLHRAGKLIYNNQGEIEFRTNDQLAASNANIKIHDPIFNFPLKAGQDVTGCYVEWSSPYRESRTGQIPKGLYRIWHDPYAHDINQKELTIKHSLGVTYVFEVVNNFTPSRGGRIVANYAGRPSTTDEYNEELYKIVKRWNGELMFENNRGDVKGFFGKKKALHLLAEEPDLEWEKELKGKKRTGAKGIHINDARKSKGAIYLRDWLITQVSTDGFGNPKLNLHYIYDAAFLRELLKWNLKGNFDRVSTFIVGMFDEKQCSNNPPHAPEPEDPNDFWNRNLF